MNATHFPSIYTSIRFSGSETVYAIWYHWLSRRLAVEMSGSGYIPQSLILVIERRGCRYEVFGDRKSEGVRPVIPKCKKNSFYI